MNTPIEKIFEMLENNDISNLSELKEWFIVENEIYYRKIFEEKLKKEHYRIWEGLFFILPNNDFGDLEDGDKLHKLIFHKEDK